MGIFKDEMKEMHELRHKSPEKSDQKESIVEEAKYPTLRTISLIYKVLAVINGLGALIAIIYGLLKSEMIIITYSLVSGIIGVIAFLAISEIIKLFIDLEQNSRKQIMLFNKMLDKNENKVDSVTVI